MRTDTDGPGAPGRTNGARAPSSRQQRRRERTRAALVDAARDCFRRKGPVATTVSDITDGADVGHGTFYSYFGSKDEVFTEIADELLADLLSALHEVGRARSIKERLRAGIGALFHRCAANREIVLASWRAGHAHTGHDARWDRFRGQLKELVHRDLDWLSSRHYTKPMRVDLVSTVIARMVEGVVLDIVSSEEADVDALLETTVDLYYDAVFRPRTQQDDFVVG